MQLAASWNTVRSFNRFLVCNVPQYKPLGNLVKIVTGSSKAFGPGTELSVCLECWREGFLENQKEGIANMSSKWYSKYTVSHYDFGLYCTAVTSGCSSENNLEGGSLQSQLSCAPAGSQRGRLTTYVAHMLKRSCPPSPRGGRMRAQPWGPPGFSPGIGACCSALRKGQPGPSKLHSKWCRCFFLWKIFKCLWQNSFFICKNISIKFHRTFTVK